MKLQLLIASLMTSTCLTGIAADITPAWNSLSIKEFPNQKQLHAAPGGVSARITTEPDKRGISRIHARLIPGGVLINTRDMKEAGVRKVNFLLLTIPQKEFPRVLHRLTLDLQGPANGEAHFYFEGITPEGKHFYKRFQPSISGERQTLAIDSPLPAKLRELHLRFDLLSPGEWKIFGASFAPLPPPEKRKTIKPELFFHLPFDGTAEAAVARGEKKPRESRNLEFVPGLSGQALRSTKKAGTLLRYALPGNLLPERGTIALWIKPEWQQEEIKAADHRFWYTFLSADRPTPRSGSGAVWLWGWGSTLRGDTSDLKDSYVTSAKPLRNGIWQHVAFTWDESGADLYIDGKRASHKADGDSPLKFRDRIRRYRPLPIDSFFVGGHQNQEQADALLDDLRIYSAPLSEQAIQDLVSAHRSGEVEVLTRYLTPQALDRFAFRITNHAKKDQFLDWKLSDETGKTIVSGRSAELPPGKSETIRLRLPALSPGGYRLTAGESGDFFRILHPTNPFSGGTELKTTLLETISPSPALGPERFLSIGKTLAKTVEGKSYLEAGEERGDRFALRFHLPDTDHLYFIEWDYPDDRKRTCDIIAQSSRMKSNEYELQVGYCTGDEYPNSHRMLTSRMLYFPRSTDVTLIFMSARENAPAAAGEIRIYRVEGKLPPAAITPAPAVDGWTRTVGVYYEDPAINSGFGADGTSEAGFEQVIDRLSAYMKFSGQNLLAYPLVWYHGFIGERYNPRNHIRDFSELLLTRFDAEGLEFLATMNQNNMTIPETLVNAESVADGSLHSTAVSIWSTGKPNPGGWHGTAPNFNILHPDSKRELFANIDRILEIGAKHPSFKGIVLHLPRHAMLWFGDITAGYNDYMIAGFEKDTGIQVPVDRKDPMRGKAYADWLLTHAKEAWIDWRCRKLAALYREAADRISARRADLRLVINSMIPVPEMSDPRYTNPDYVRIKNREAGLNPNYFADTPNIILDQTIYPADYRWREGRRVSPAAWRRLRSIDTEQSYYELLLNARTPWIHMHDRYWESAIGSTRKGHWSDKPNALNAPWLREQSWRVSTLNPAGFHAMRHYVLPLRYTDLLGITKGGFLIGSYGMEPLLTPFIKAFRALPAKRFHDLPGGSDFIKARALEYGGAFWFYVVNTHHVPGTVKISVNGECTDLVTGGKQNGSFELALAPYELRSFRAPAGSKIAVSCR